MRFNLDKMERLIARIRVTEAELDKLYSELELEFGVRQDRPASGEIASESTGKGGRKPQPDSLQGRLLAHLEGFRDLSFSVEDAAQAPSVNEPDLAKVRRALDKMVSVGKIERRGRGMYGALRVEVVAA